MKSNAVGFSGQFAECDWISSEHRAALTWNYGGQEPHIESLYDLAKAKMWNAASDVDWTRVAREGSFPTLPEESPLSGYSEYERLPEAERLAAAWSLHSMELSEVLHGEQGALLVASQLVTCMPTIDSKLFASTQVFDEARHVEFFARYLRESVGTVFPPSQELKALLEKAVADPRWDIKFIVCQILIESLAMAKFQELRRVTQVPILQFAVNYILKDEARHVNFGVEILKDHLKALSKSEIEDRSKFVLDSLMSLAKTLNYPIRVAEQLGWNQAQFRYHLRKFRISKAEVSRNRFRQLSQNLSAVGLLTEITAERIESLRLS